MAESESERPEEQKVSDTLHQADETASDAVSPDEKTEPETKDDPTATPAGTTPAAGRFSKLKRLWSKYWNKKKWTIPATVLVLLLIVFAIPYTRYNALGMVLRKPVTVTVVDSKTNTPVSAASVSLAGKTFKTDGSGKAVQKLNLGTAKLAVSKQYFETANKQVTIKLSHNNFRISLVATGRQVPLTVLDRVTGQPIAGAVIKVLNTEAKTDKTGKATIVLPTSATTQKATISRSGFNASSVTIQVTDKVVAANSFSLIQSGKIYFLSNKSGKIDVVKTNLDGSDRQTVLAGTGNEEPYTTSLLASRDWKYLALLSKRTNSGNAELNLIDTSTDKVTNIDQGDATFSLVGWDDDSFIYVVSRNGVNNWQPNASSLKSYNAQNNKLLTLDSTKATGTSNADAKYEVLFSNAVHIVGTDIVYSKIWYSYPGYINVADQQNTLNSINADGSGKKTVAAQSGATAYFGTLFQYSPKELIVQISYNDNSPQVYYKYVAGGAYTKDAESEDITALNNGYGANYSTYLQSPSGNQTFWSAQRDGKNALFLGNDRAENQKQIAALSEYGPFGWYTDNYLLVSKNSSELYIMAPGENAKPLKITDYYKPPINYQGYGGGYGGL